MMNRFRAQQQQVPNNEHEDNVPDDEQQQNENGTPSHPSEETQGDYLDVQSRPFLLKILQKQGDSQVLFADKVLKFTASGKMKRRFLIITDSAVYIVDPERDRLKRRITLAAVDRMFMSELSDNFFSIIIPTEYDLLMASTRKTEIATFLFEAIKASAEYELGLTFSNSFEYNATASLIKEVQFEEIEGAVRTRIVMKND